MVTTIGHYSTTRYQQEEAERRERVEREQREAAEQKRREKVREEASLRDRLIHSVHQLEQRRKELQRELVLRDNSQEVSSRQRRESAIQSAVVVPSKQPP